MELSILRQTTPSGDILPESFYQKDDVVAIARSLIGKGLCSFIEGKFTRGMIVETEAYDGLKDRACHSYGGKRTQRTEVMYDKGGICYIYLCYGMHHLFNIVTNKKGRADAVLIRAIHPTDGEALMLKRRSMKKIIPALTAGPARFSQAMGLSIKYNGYNLTEKPIYLDKGYSIPARKIQSAPRVGIDYAGQDAFLPWRFYLQDDPFVSIK